MKQFALIAFAASLVSFAPQDPPKKAAAGPAERQEDFLATLKAGKIEKAYDALFKGSRFADKPDQVENLIDQTAKGVGLYGGVVGFENTGIIRQEKYQALGMGILCCDQVPMYFYFVWYRSAETAPWAVINVWFSDQVKDYWMLRR